jgi:hypothetical protein
VIAARERRLAFAAISVVVIALLWPERGYVPIWDGRVYANCVVDAAATGFSFESLRCAGHPSQGWALLLAAPQALALGDVRLMHLTDLVLGLFALACIRAILARAFPDPTLDRNSTSSHWPVPCSRWCCRRWCR